MMNQVQLYTVVTEWLRGNVESNDGDWYTTIVSMAICDIDTDIALDRAEYPNWDEEDYSGIEYKEEGATHMVRFLTVGTADLVDGDNFYFKIEDGQFVLINEPDRPAFCGGYLDEGMKWVAERSLRYASSMFRDDL